VISRHEIAPRRRITAGAGARREEQTSSEVSHLIFSRTRLPTDVVRPLAPSTQRRLARTPTPQFFPGPSGGRKRGFFEKIGNRNARRVSDAR
jgi:hypothetical protein